jgi:GTP cyclohydrolase FolE2
MGAVQSQRIAWFRVHAINQESLHNNSAFATIVSARP